MPIANRHVTLYRNPKSRSKGVLILLEELGADYRAGTRRLRQRRAAGAGVPGDQPDGQVPAIDHAGAVVTEQVAIYQYLADLYPEAGLAPAMGDPRRGSYLRWLAFYGSAFEPSGDRPGAQARGASAGDVAVRGPRHGDGRGR